MNHSCQHSAIIIIALNNSIPKLYITLNKLLLYTIIPLLGLFKSPLPQKTIRQSFVILIIYINNLNTMDMWNSEGLTTCSLKVFYPDISMSSDISKFFHAVLWSLRWHGLTLLVVILIL